MERPAPALVSLEPPHQRPLPAARREGKSGQLVPPGELALADFDRHLSLSARRRTAGAYLDTLQRLLAFLVCEEKIRTSRGDIRVEWRCGAEYHAPDRAARRRTDLRAALSSPGLDQADR